MDEAAVTSRGYRIYREPNAAGGWRYWSDSIAPGVLVYDTCLVSREEIELALHLEAIRENGDTPMQFEIAKFIEIDAAHRVPHHGSKCLHVHGHRYKIEAFVRGELVKSGPETGMVLDFSFLKEEMVEEIDVHADHAMIAWQHDPFLDQFEQTCGKLLVLPYVPTAENLAMYWYDRLAPRILVRSDGKAKLARLRVYETPTCFADYPAGA